MNHDKIVRWGILSTARIATTVAKAIDATEGARVDAVASRSQERAAEWADQHGTARSYGSYQALLDDDQLDAIYIPLPPSMHAEWTIRCAEAGKHVLCEKPLALSATEGAEMATACRENAVQLMDGTMWVHHPRAADMLGPIRDGTLGEPRRITSGFGFLIETYLRDNPSHMARDAESGQVTPDDALANELRLQRAMGGGALLDLGWYCIRATLWAFGGMPQRVFGTARYRNDVDLSFSALMWYDNERMASFDCGFDISRRKWFEVVGTDASLVCDDFVNPWDSARPRFLLHDEPGAGKERVSAPLIQEQCMIDAFCRIVRTGELDPFWPSISIANQRLCDLLDQSARSGKIVEVA